MRTNRERLVNQFSAVATCLGGETWVHSDHLMSSTRSLGFKDFKELTPRGVQDGLRPVMVLDHIGDLKVLYRDTVILLGVRLCHLEMVIAALTIDLEMGLGYVFGGLAAASTAFVATAHRTLLAPERALRGAIEAWVLYRVALAVGQETLQSHINPDVSMCARDRGMRSRWFYLTDAA